MKLLLISVVLLALLSLAVQWRAKARETAIAMRFPPLGEKIEVDGVEVHAVVRGDGPDLVLIHGSSGNLRDFAFRIIDRLAQDYRVIALDRPGLGYSQRLGEDNETISDQARLLQKAAAQLGAERPIVLGHSYGGAVALAWAVEFPETLSALVLVAAPTQPWDGHVPFLYRMNGSAVGGALAVPLITAFVPQSYVHSQIRQVFAPEAMPEGYDDDVGAELATRRTALRANADQRVRLLAQITALQPRYDGLSLPIELIHGDADTTVGLAIHAHPFIAQVESARLAILEGAGHLPHHTHMDAFEGAIDRAAMRAGLR